MLTPARLEFGLLPKPLCSEEPSLVVRRGLHTPPTHPVSASMMFPSSKNPFERSGADLDAATALLSVSPQSLRPVRPEVLRAFPLQGVNARSARPRSLSLEVLCDAAMMAREGEDKMGIAQGGDDNAAHKLLRALSFRKPLANLSNVGQQSTALATALKGTRGSPLIKSRKITFNTEPLSEEDDEDEEFEMKPQAHTVRPAPTVAHPTPPRREERVGIFTPIEREELIRKFLAKRLRRVWFKKVRYTCRAGLAQTRVRVKGRFVKVV